MCSLNTFLNITLHGFLTTGCNTYKLNFSFCSTFSFIKKIYKKTGFAKVHSCFYFFFLLSADPLYVKKKISYMNIVITYY